MQQNPRLYGESRHVTWVCVCVGVCVCVCVCAHIVQWIGYEIYVDQSLIHHQHDSQIFFAHIFMLFTVIIWETVVMVKYHWHDIMI